MTFPKFPDRLTLPIVLLTVLSVTIGYGVSFPLLAIRLEAMEVSAGLIGLNAAMPAIGWLILTPMLPLLHRKFSSKTLMLSFLLVALLGLVGFASVQSFAWWLGFRLAFGGGLGMFFRVVEYWLNTATHKHNRGRVIGFYSVSFLSGIAIGSLSQPSLATIGFSEFKVVGISIVLGGLLLISARLKSELSQNTSAPFGILRSAMVAAPLAMVGVVVYGLIEDVPAYLLSVYTLQLGLGEDIAAYTLTAFAVGNLILAIPLGILSDRIGRFSVLVTCGFVGLVGVIVVPLSTDSTTIYLALLAIWGGFVGGLYNVSLASIGDQFSEEKLIAANAAFGTIYAAAAMIGPLINGTAMQIGKPNGLMLSCAVIFGGFLVFAVINNLGGSSIRGQSSKDSA